MDASDIAEVVLVAVSLEYRQNAARTLQLLTDDRIVPHAVVASDIESLVGKDNYRFLTGCQFCCQPLQFLRRNICIGPLKVLPTVGNAIVPKAGIKDNQVNPRSSKAVE